jgi:hypothetical protein
MKGEERRKARRRTCMYAGRQTERVHIRIPPVCG